MKDKHYQDADNQMRKLEETKRLKSVEDKKNGIESVKGATHIEMIDLESEPGRIKFAWPLNDVITAVPGVVKFSIRFCRLNDGSVDSIEIAKIGQEAENVYFGKPCGLLDQTSMCA